MPTSTPICENRQTVTGADWQEQKITITPTDIIGLHCDPIELNETHTRCDSSADTSTHVGNPIDCATGQKVQTEVDYPGFGPDPITYRRTYISPISEEEKPHTFCPNSLPQIRHRDFSDGAELLILTQDCHLRRAFFKAANGGWQSNPDLPAIGIVETPSGGYTLHLNDGRLFHISSTYQVQSVAHEQSGTDPRYSYEYADFFGVQRLHRQSNRFGRFLEHDYNADGDLISLTDQDGHRIDYEYDNDGNLSRIFFPTSTPTSERPNRQYLYELNGFPHHLTGIIDERGNRFATFSYDETGRAIATEHHDGAERVSVSYPTDNTAIVRFYRDTQANQYREEHFTYGRFRGTYRLTRREVTQCEDCQVGTERWNFNTQGLLTQHIDFNGNRQTWVYDELGRKTQHTQAVGTTEESTTHYTWIGDSERMHTEQRGNQLRTFIYDTQGRVVSETRATLP